MTAARLSLFQSGTAEKLEGIRRIPGSLSLSCSFEEDAPHPPPPCTCSAPSCCPSLAGVDPLAELSGRRFSLLDRRCCEHDFGVQPGLPPSGRESVNDFDRHDVSNRKYRFVCVVFNQHIRERFAFLFIFFREKSNTVPRDLVVSRR